MDFIISLVVILIFVAVSMKKSGQLDEIMNGMKKKNQNEADNVVYEQTEDAPKKKKAKAKKGGGVPRNIGKGVGIAAAVLVAAVLAFDSYYTLSEEEMAVVTTFGKPSVQEASGLHFKVPLIQQVTKISKAITGMQIGYTTDPERAEGASMENPVSIEKESLMITNDFNLINVDFYVEYMVTDPIQAVRHRNVYESIIKNLAQSYIRDTVGLYNVSIQDSGMPREDVSNAFKAVEDAKQGMETAINTAKKYQSENIPKANAEADKLLQEAEAYKQQRINEANGQVARFEDTYAEYVKYPLITKKRMFYETMEELLPDLKVIIDNGSGTQTMLPLEPFANVTEGTSGNQTPQAAAPAGQ